MRIFWWKRVEQQPVDESSAELENARERHTERVKQWEDVRAVSEDLRDEISRNHFGEVFRRTMAGRA